MIDEAISQFMNREVLKGEPETPLSEVIALMHSRVQSCFVVCEDGTPVGVITERDAVAVLDRKLAGERYQDVRAADVMTCPVHTLPETSTMGEVMRIMNERKFRRVPITGDKNELSGIVNLMELQAAMNAALERRGRDLEVAVMERTAELQAANAKLEELSIRDGLTGLLNRRAMTKKLEHLHDLSQRYGNPFSVILLDIDHFKSYNDALGHVQGDEAIREIAELLHDSVRTSDTVYRYGGEEFLIAMPETDHESALAVAQRIRQETEARALPHPNSPTGPVITVSLGHTSVTCHNVEQFDVWNDVVEDADKALYRAKQGGRNRIEGPLEAR
ncbi:MAG: diguanylate cyclase [Myxococcota bacterium]